MAWVFREMPGISTPNTALLVIMGAVLWFPISFAAATARCMRYCLHKITSYPAWMQLLHPLATVIAKSKLPGTAGVLPAAWPQAKNNQVVQLVFKGYETPQAPVCDQKGQVPAIGRQRSSALRRLRGSRHTVGIASAITPVVRQGACHAEAFRSSKKPSQKLSSYPLAMVN